MGYVETLFGHQDFVLSVDSLRGETAVSCGGRDRTVRFWKIVDETQLVFRGGGRSKMREVLEGGAFEGMEDDDEPKQKPVTTTRSFIEGSMECVAMVDEETFLSGGDSGLGFLSGRPHQITQFPHRSISLWTTQKKKPVFTQALAHGLNETATEDRGVVISPRWITALGSLQYSDVIASGKPFPDHASTPINQFIRLLGWSDKTMEVGRQASVLLTNRLPSSSRYRQFHPTACSPSRSGLGLGSAVCFAQVYINI